MPLFNPPASSFSTITTFEQGTFTPTVTLVGGAGNTVPQYTNNLGTYVRINNTIFVEILLEGDGGNEGAGTGQVNIALPFSVTSASSYTLGPGLPFSGSASNGTSFIYILGVGLAPSATTAAIYYVDTSHLGALLTGADQSGTGRGIRLQFQYETDA